MKNELHTLLRKIKSILPNDRQEAFAGAIRSRLGELEALAVTDGHTIAKYTIFGVAIGAVMDLIPGLESLLGVDGFVDVGGALGAFVGLAKSTEEMRRREQIRGIIIEELNRIQMPL